MKQFISILTLFLLFWASQVIADDDVKEAYRFEADNTLFADPILDGRTLNGIFSYKHSEGENELPRFWVVGDSGLVLRYKDTIYTGQYPFPFQLVKDYERVLNPTNNLMSVSFENEDVGWIVGYINNGTDMWKGVIYITTNGGGTWTPQTNISPVDFVIPTPFLKVQTVGKGVVWISCGNGEVLRTANYGESWVRKTKPDGESHYGWLNGLYAFNDSIAWVASDQSGLVARTMNRGDNWFVYHPALNQINPPDSSIVYFDIHPGSNWEHAYITASHGKVLKASNGGGTWDEIYPDDRVSSCQSWKACMRQSDDQTAVPDLFVGTGSVRKWPKLGYNTDFRTPPYDFNDIGYVKSRIGNKRHEWCVAVGTPWIVRGQPYRNVRYWYIWDSIPPFEIMNIANEGNFSDYFTLKLKVKNNTEQESTVRVLLWRSLWKNDYYIPWDTFISPTINPNAWTEWYEYVYPPDTITAWYGATLLDFEPLDIRYSLEVVHGKKTEGNGSRPVDPNYFIAPDIGSDHGGKVLLKTGRNCPRYLFWKEPPDNHVYLQPYWVVDKDYRGTYVGEYIGGANTFAYCTTGVLTGTATTFRVWGYNGYTTSVDYLERTPVAYDNVSPPVVTGVTHTIPNPYTIILKWDPVPREAEWNLGGYEVKMEKYGHPEDQLGQQKAPIVSTMRTFRIHPAMVGYPGFWYVRAVDRSGNTSTSWSDELEVTLPKNIYIPGPYGNYSTAFTQGRHLVRTPNSKEIYMTFESEGKIYLSLTTNEGENWETEDIDNGYYPCVGLNYRGLPWIAYCKDGDLICKMKRADGSWKEMLIFDGNERHWAGPPSMQLATMPIKEDVIDYAYIAYAVYDGKISENPGPQPPSEIEYSYIYVSLFDTTGIDIVTHLIDESPADAPVSLPCVSVTPSDLIHIAWQQKDEIWYITNTDKVTPENWSEVEWTPKYNLSYTDDISEHPFVESYGDIVTVVWKEGECGEIFRKQRYAWEPSEYEKWTEPENLSNSPEFNSDYPQMSTREVVLWQEQGEDSCYKVYANICGEILCITPEANNVSYIHANALVDDPMAPKIMVYYCYTDEITENELYEVKFDKYHYPDGIAIPPGDTTEVKYYEGKLGEETASTYLESRDGYINYGNYKIDYGNNNLKYKLKYLNPCKKYLFQGILYQCTTATIHQQLDIEDTLASDNTISYAIPETISFFIRKNSYKEDLESKIKLNKIQDAYSVLAKFKLYEYEEIDTIGGGSGPQSAGTERLSIPAMLYSPKPNPFNNRTEIKFQIPVRTDVELKVYNSTGRLVKTIIDEHMRPGIYNLTWDDKDNQNRIQSKGIYFVRLRTNDYSETKKIVMVK